MEIPLEARISFCIEQGSIFNFELEVAGKGRQSKNRYFVVLNHNPKTDDALIMVTSTSQIAKKKEFVKRAGIDERTIVILPPGEFPVFKIETAFNCNDVYEVKMSDLIEKIHKGGSMNYPKLPDDILSRLKSAVNSSPRVSPAIKKLL